MALTIITIFFASFFRVFIKAFQQKNVMHDQWRWVVPTSCLLAIAEFLTIGLTAVTYVSGEGYLFITGAILALGCGGGIGCLLSMIAHNKLSGITKAKRR